MEDIKHRIAYLQGLAEGLDNDEENKEGRVLTSIIEVLDGLAKSLETIRNAQHDLENYVESIDEDLGDLEDEIFQDEENNYVEVQCPQCQEKVFFETDLLEDEDVIEITCPSCNEVVFINDPPFSIENRQSKIEEDI